MTRKINRELADVANMPPLYHTLPGEEYDPEKSEVLKWLSTRPELISYLFSRVRNFKEVAYDPETGIWQGINWEE